MVRRWPAPRKLLVWAAAVIGTLVVIAGAFLFYLFTSSPPEIRNPYMQHYHFRMQIIVNGRAVNFAEAKFQTGESTASCDVALPAVPVHFHDDKNQITHIHWDGMTGGLVLKDYGWNYIGGADSILGYRFDQLPHIKKVPIHGQALPAVPAGANFYVYTGDESSFKERDFTDFLTQDLEVFFHHPSNLPSSKPKTGLLDKLFPAAYAQQPQSLSAPQLERLNNLIGNVVIFVQPNKPAGNLVKARFNQLEPLSASVCGS